MLSKNLLKKPKENEKIDIKEISGKEELFLKLKSFIYYIRHDMGSTTQWWVIWLIFVFTAVTTRLININYPTKVIWDEAHFGKMMGWYLNGTYFFDVHPPGGKLLITLFAYLGNYKADHSFETPGISIEGYTGIISARVGSALVGSCIVPFGFCSVWRLTSSLMAATIAAVLITLDLGSIVLSKYILLDPFLMCFIMASFHGLTIVHDNRNREYSIEWWGAMSYTGCMLGCVMSVKFVGAFIVGLVGVYITQDLWTKFGMRDKSILKFINDLNARIVTLILLPITIYTFAFAIHDGLLYTQRMPHDNGVGFYSTRFQMNIQNSYLYNLSQPLEVSYGNIATIRSSQLGGAYLHSHDYSFPGRNLTQVTGYRGKDINNYFQILYPEDDPEDPHKFYYEGNLEKIMNGDWIRLQHIMLNKTVTVSKQPAVITKKQYFVYAKDKNLPAVDGDALNSTILEEIDLKSKSLYEMWSIQLIDSWTEDGNESNSSTIQAIHHRVKFISVALRCALTCARTTLPKDWGFDQEEITCTKNLQDPFTEWLIEFNHNSNDANMTDFSHLKSGFLDRMVETHQMMAHVNSKLKPKGQDLFHAHKPWMWPICYRSQPWYDDGFRIVLLGNPAIFFVNFIALIVGPLLLLKHAVKTARRDDQEEENLDQSCCSDEDEATSRTLFAVRWLLLAYLLHYLPFYAMNRVLYYHHYFPALHFSSMLTGVLLGRWIDILRGSRSVAIARILPVIIFTIFMIIITLSFTLYYNVGLGYPTTGPYNSTNSTYRHIRLFEEWEI